MLQVVNIMKAESKEMWRLLLEVTEEEPSVLDSTEKDCCMINKVVLVAPTLKELFELIRSLGRTYVKRIIRITKLSVF